jgi:hypothetical protein
VDDPASRSTSDRGSRRVLIPLVLAAAVAGLLVYGSLPGGQPAGAATARYYAWSGGTPPIGITLSGLQAYLMTPKAVATLEHQMLAAKTYWHANTIRLQVTQDRLVGADGKHFRPGYMADVRAVTDYGLCLGLTIVLNARTQLQIHIISMPDTLTAMDRIRDEYLRQAHREPFRWWVGGAAGVTGRGSIRAAG